MTNALQVRAYRATAVVPLAATQERANAAARSAEARAARLAYLDAVQVTRVVVDVQPELFTAQSVVTVEVRGVPLPWARVRAAWRRWAR